MVGSKHIGRKALCVLSASAPGLGIKTTSATLNFAGKTPVERDLLKSSQKDGIKIAAIYLKISAVTPSKTGTLDGPMLLMVLSTSSIVIGGSFEW